MFKKLKIAYISDRVWALGVLEIHEFELESTKNSPSDLHLICAQFSEMGLISALL